MLVALTNFGTNWSAFSKPANQAETMDEKILYALVYEWGETEREREREREESGKIESEMQVNGCNS